MKKLLSVILAMLMVIGSISCLFTLNVAAESDELITDGDMESDAINVSGKVASVQNVLVSEFNSNRHKYANKWLRASGGNSVTDTNSSNSDWVAGGEETFPTYFAPNTKQVTDPLNPNNKVLRSVQSTIQFLDSSKFSANSTYSFKMKFINRCLSSETMKLYVYFVTPMVTAENKLLSTFNLYAPITKVETVKASGGVSSVGITGDNKLLISVPAGPSETWQEVEVLLTVGDKNANELFNPDAVAISLHHDVSLDSNNSSRSTKAVYYDDVSLKEVVYENNVIGDAEFYNANGTKITDSNEFAQISKTVNGNNVTVTANNNLESGLTFIGWYKNGELYSNNQTITVAKNDTAIYVPRYKSSNLLASSASFENIESNTSMRYVEYHPADGAVPNYPEGNLWGIAAINGYLTYNEGNLNSHRVSTYDEDIYSVDGTKAHQTYSYRNVSWTSYTNGAMVVSGDAHTGNRALKIINADMCYVMGIDVKPNNDYTLTYYVKDDTEGVTSTSGYGSAILSTVNISASVHQSGGGEVAVAANLPEHIFGSSIENAVPYTFSSNKMKDVPDTWTKVEHKFNSGMHEKVYFVVGNRLARNTPVLLDDITLMEEAKELKPTATANISFVDKNGNTIANNNAYASVAVTVNEDETNTLAVDYLKDTNAYAFLGWFDAEGNLVSTDETYVGAPAGKYTAKIKDANIYTAASYEGYDAGASLSHTDKSVNFPINGQWGGFAWAGYRKQTAAGTIYDNQGNAYTQTAGGTYQNGVTATVSNAYAHSGSKSLLLSGTYWTMVGGINNVKAGKTYELSFWVKKDPTLTTATKIKGVAVLTTVNIGQSGISEFATHITEKYSTIGLPWDDGKYYQSNLDISSGDWVKVSTRFKVPEAATDLDTVYLSLDASGDDATCAGKMYIDDISVVEVFDGIKTAYNDAAAIRTAAASSTGKNGLRIYNRIQKEFINDMNIVEYGSIVTLSSKLDGELTFETTTPFAKGMAYNSTTLTTPLLWDEDEYYNIYTSYLTNIPEAKYGDSYVIRAYAIDGAGYAYYGEPIALSVYDVVLAMDNGNGVTTQTPEDVAAFKVFAGGQDGKYTMYDNWLKDSLKFAGKLRNIQKAEDTLSGAELTKALEVDGYYEPFFERAIANEGNRALLKTLFEKAERGEDITIVGFGGSITQKAACTNELDSYSHQVAVWFREQFDITVNWYNAGIGSTTSVLGIARMQDHVLAYNPDLVILDFTTNDQTNDYHAGSYESILRTLYAKKIAVVTIAFGNVVNTEYKNQGLCHRGTNREDLHGPVMLYNDVPVIDYYGVMWDCYLDADGDGYNVDSDAAHWKTLWADYIHPTVAGHKLAGNAINYYLAKVYADLDNITETLTYPAMPLDKYTENFMGSMMYGNANIGDILTDSNNVTIGNYNNYDSTTVSNWTIWQIAQGGYIEFTISKAKMFALMSINEPSAPKAEIYVNGTLATTHTASRADGTLNWMNFIKFMDGEETVTIKIVCTSGTYRITAALIAQGN